MTRSRLLDILELLAEEAPGHVTVILAVPDDAQVDRTFAELGRPHGVGPRDHIEPRVVDLEGTRWRGAETRIAGATVLVSGPHTRVAAKRAA